MFTTIDKMWTALFGSIVVFVAEAMLAGDRTATEVIMDKEVWLMAVATAALVWAVPNKEKSS